VSFAHGELAGGPVMAGYGSYNPNGPHLFVPYAERPLAPAPVRDAGSLRCACCRLVLAEVDAFGLLDLLAQGHRLSADLVAELRLAGLLDD
jgi:hypothetical protein